MKRVLALLLALAMMLSFAACSGKKDEETTANSETAESVDGIVEMDDETDLETETETEAESETAEDGTVVNTKKPAKKPAKIPANVPSSGTKPTDKPIKPDVPDVEKVDPSKHKFDIKVRMTDKGKIVTVDGVEYNLRKANGKNNKDGDTTLGQAELIDLIMKEKDNDLQGQLYAADPSIAVDLGLLAMQGGNVLSYTYDINGQYFWIDDIHSWQQNFGFNPLYDFGAQFIVMYYDTLRLEFNYTEDFENQPWMIQLWRGQYGFLFIGGEIGLYTIYENTPSSSNPDLRHYDCATEDLLPMEQIIWRRDAEGVLHPLFHAEKKLHWWSTGFIPGALVNFASRDELVMEGAIDFSDHDGMADVVEATMVKRGFKEVTEKAFSAYTANVYYRTGDTIRFTWGDGMRDRLGVDR